MRKIYYIPLGTDFIEELSNFILRDGKALSEIAIVFAGKRPSIYLRKKFAHIYSSPFYSPHFFSIEEFIDYIAKKKYKDFTDLEYVDAIYLLYQSIQSLKEFNTHPFRQMGLGEFFYWGKYILDFINQLDVENISDDKLHSVEKNAEIGYDVPESVNELLQRISVLRKEFHKRLEENKFFTRGYKYLCALEIIDKIGFQEFKKIYFAGLFGLTGAEKAIIKKIWQKDKADIIWEGEPENWQILKNLLLYFNAELQKIPAQNIISPNIKIYSGFDIHSEIIKVYKILKETKSYRTVIVLPASESLFPLLSFAIDRLNINYNISLGYPLLRTSLFDLLSNIINAQISRRKGNLYSTKNYLDVLLHPFVKNLNLEINIRTLVYQIEKALSGEILGSHIANKVFIKLEEIENEKTIFSLEEKSKEIIKKIHIIFFKNLENFTTLYEIAERIEEVLDFVLEYTPVRSYVLSGEIFKLIFESLDKLKNTKFSKKIFVQNNDEENRRAICDFILQYLKTVSLPFETKPLEPLEIIGVLETRNISFDTVIMLDVNEGIIPEPKKIDPLVPLGVYEQLGIPSPEYNEEIYRYYFYRLINSAKNVHLLYIDSEDKPRSRYIEQILWNKEKSKKKIDIIKVEKSIYRINLKPLEQLPEIKKTEKIIEILKNRKYSPSEIDNYLLCPVFFYYKHILGFEPKKEISEDIEVTDRGLIIHSILNDTFNEFKNIEITPSLYNKILNKMMEMIEKHFRNKVITGEYYLFKKITEYKLKLFLEKDVIEAKEKFKIKYLEQTIEDKINIDNIFINFKGRIDRIDFYPSNNEYIIIDYKTGGSQQYKQSAVINTDFNSIENIHKNIKTLQLPIYVYLFHKKFNVSVKNINAKLVLLQDNSEELLFKKRFLAERENIEKRYIEGVKTILRNILDTSKPFKPYDDEYCSTCEFNNLCHI